MTLAKIEHLALCNRCLKVKAYSSEREVAHACDYGSATAFVNVAASAVVAAIANR